jgi:hypothetical protein
MVDRYTCDSCFAFTAYSKPAMLGHLFAEHPKKSTRPITLQTMTVVLERLSKADIDKQMGKCNEMEGEDEDGKEMGMWDLFKEDDRSTQMDQVSDAIVIGGLVWAKQKGSPWWPGVLIHEAGNKWVGGHFRRLHGGADDIEDETEYNVLFFDDSTSFKRAWIPESHVVAFEGKNQKKLSEKTGKFVKKRRDMALEWVDEVSDMSSAQRWKYFSSQMDENDNLN